MSYPAYVLPGIQEDILDSRNIKFRNKYGELALKVPKIEKELFLEVMNNLSVSRDHLLQKATSEILDAIIMTTELWLEPNFQYRKMAENWLPIVTGFSPQMVCAILDGIMKKLSKELHHIQLPAKRSIVERVICVLEEIPGPEVIALISALSNKSAIFFKSPQSEPLFATLYAQSFADVDKSIANCIAVGTWEGGKPENNDLEKFVYGETTERDAAVVFGNIDTAESIKQKTNSNAKLTPFTGGISFGIIGKEMLEKEIADKVVSDAAIAVCMYV
jgi:hypothetical protein